MGFLLSKFTAETFLAQQNVVSNEKRQYDNQPYSQTSYIMDKLMYPDQHPYNWQVIGSLDDLANASIKDAIDFHNKYYGPSNATLVVAGDIDVPETKIMIEKYFEEIKSTPQPKILPKMLVTVAATKRVYYEDNLANAPQLNIEFATVEDFSKDSYALEFLGELLAGSKKSPFYKVLIEEKKLAPTVYARQGSAEIAGSFGITVRAFPTTKLGDVDTAVQEAFARFEKDGFTEKDLERQKAGIEYRFYTSIASVLGKSMRLADYNIFKGSPDYLSTDFKNSLKVTKDDVWRVYKKYIKGKNYIMLSTVPKGKSELTVPHSEAYMIAEESIDKQGTKRKDTSSVKPEPILSKIDRTKEPEKGPDPTVNIPAIWSSKTTNGIPIFGIKQSELPIVQFSIILKGGKLLDQTSSVGIASMTARMMNEGTKTKTPIELREAIEDLGANLSVSGGDESITITGACLASKLKGTFALAKEMLYEPRWDEKEFPIVKSQTIEALKRSETSPTSIASNVFDKLIYGSDNILALQTQGTKESVEKITMDDLKKFYDGYFSASVTNIMILGDISKEQATALFEGLNDWKVKDVKIPEATIGNVPKPGVYFIDIPKAKQSVFNVGHLGLKYTDPDYYKAYVMNYRLGGDFSAILNMILREAKSFTYGARSGFSGSTYPGTFKASTQVQANATLETGQIIRDEIAKFRNGISAEDLALVKSTLLKSNAGQFETLMQLSRMLTPIVMYGVPFDYIKQREDIVRNMTPEEEKALAQKYLQPENMVYVVVGDKETQFDKLKELGLGDPVLLDRDAKPMVK